MPPTNGDDKLEGTTKADVINALAGNDTIDAKTRPSAPGSDIDLVDGGIGFDTLIVNCSAETQAVSLGAGGSPSFTVRSTSNNFFVDAYSIERVLFTGGSGNDTIDTGVRGGTVNGGGGIDHWFTDLSGLFSNVVFNLGATTSIAAAGLTSILAIERLTMVTGSGNDTISGGAQGDSITTGEGDDIIDARTRSTAVGAAFDVVDGGLDTDTLVVNAAAETEGVQLSSGGSPTFTVRSTSERFFVDAYNMERIDFTGGSGNDVIASEDHAGKLNGGTGTDHWIADLSAVSSNISYAITSTKNIAAADIAVDGMERLTLTTGSGNDSITSDSQGDAISTGAGNDFINLGTRQTAAGSATDYGDGGSGVDTLSVNAAGETQSVTLSSGGSPTFTVRSTSGKYFIDAYNMERITIATGAGADVIDTADHAGSVDGNGGTDHWSANLSAIATDITFVLGTTTAVAAAGLTSILDIERISLETGGGNDTVAGGAQGDTINTGAGNDAINAKSRPTAAGSAIDVVNGGAGIDTLFVAASAETQAVTLSSGTSPTFTVRSTSGNYYVDAYSMEKITIATGAGADVIDTADHAGSIDGNGGIDHWLADLSAVGTGITFIVGTTTAIDAAGLTSILDIERISLETGAGNDTVAGGSQGDTITTGAGNDAINAGSRQTVAGSPIDVVNGGAGTDTLFVAASTETQSVTLSSGTSPTFTVRSISGNYYVDAYAMEKIVIATGAGADVLDTADHAGSIDGNGGIDHWFADLSAVATGITFNLGTTTAVAAAGLTSILDIERIDLVTGGGNDTISGGSQGDRITTGAGDDTINARTRPTGPSSPGDVVDGGQGNDTLVVDASAETTAVQVLAGSSPVFTVRSASDNFYVDAYAMERLVFTGGNGADTATGGILGDKISGGGGVDTLFGGEGNDTLDGGAGTDTLTGGRGADSLTGGLLGDTFDYNRVTDSGVANGMMDTITDFATGADKVDLAGIDANNLGLDGDQAFDYVGSAAFSGVAGELRSVGGLFEVDVNGDKGADLRVLIGNGTLLVETDFIL